MTDLIKAMTSAASGMQAQTARLRLSAENIANADTSGYRRKMVPFETFWAENGAQTVRAGRMRLGQGALERIHNPNHPLAGDDGYHEGSNVELVIEIADAREAQRSYEANLKMLEQAQSMTSGLLSLLRR